MGDLSCKFPTLVFSELYRLLDERPRYKSVLEDQLATINLTTDWLAEMAEAYGRKWDEERNSAEVGNLADYALPEQHSQFATWLLAHLHSSKSCGDLSTELSKVVMSRALTEIDGIALPLPPLLSPVVIGWTLGSVVSSTDDLPAAPAVWPSNENVEVAFRGLIEHVCAVQMMPQPLPEMVQTAMYWRGYGLAEALRPEAGSGSPALRRLQLEALSSMSDAHRVHVSRHLDSFGERRNALSHIADDQSRKGFIQVVDEVQESRDLHLTTRAMTQFVFYDVAQQVRQSPPSVVRRGAEEALERDLIIWS